MDDRNFIGCLEITKPNINLNSLIMKKLLSPSCSWGTKFLKTFLLVFGISLSTSAQPDINVGGGCLTNTDFIFPAQIAGASPTAAAIVASSVPGGATISMSIRSISYKTPAFPFPIDVCGVPCSGTPTTLGVIFNGIGTSSITFGGTIDASAEGDTILLTVRATIVSTATECDRNYRIPISRKPLELMVVLDGSGSMGWGYTGNTSPPAGTRRWDGLRTGMGVLTTQLNSFQLLADDRVGLRMFSNAVIIPSGAPFNGTLVPIQGNTANLLSAVPADQPGGNTALGDGILAGRNILTGGVATNRKAMLVFSDGEQNVGDMIKELPAADANTYQVTYLNQNISNSGQIKFYTVNLGVSGANPLMMSKIADKNGGAGHFLNTTAGAELDFTTFFSMQLANIFAGNSPQFIDIRKGSFSAAATPPSTEQTFSVNKGSTAVIVTLLVPTTREPRITSFMRNGVDLIQFATQSFAPGSVTIALKLPRPGVTELDGEWKVRAQLGSRPTADVPYTMLIVSDDHAVDPTYSLGGSNLKVGNSINPSVNLMHGNRAIKNATVQAFVAVPGDDINNLLALTQVNITNPTIDSASPDILKLAVLLNDSNFVKKILAQNQIINLAYNAGDSTYKGTFNGLNVTGVYQIFYRVTADDPTLGKIVRFHQNSFYVRFPDVSIPNSNFVSTIDPATGNSILTCRLKTSKDMFVGPGWGSAIGLVATGLKIIKIDDLGDGTYRIHFDGKLSGNGQISVADEVIYDGDLGDIGSKGGTDIWMKWWFWLLLILLIIILYFIFRKKKP